MPALRALGPLELRAGTTILLPGRRKVLALLAYLAHRAPRPVARAELAALLWERSDEARARQSLRGVLSELREVLGDGLLTEGDAVAIRRGAVLTDVGEFESAVRAGRFEDAAAAWSGEFLRSAEDLGGEEWRAWLDRERAALGGLLARTLDTLSRRAEAAGDGAAALSWARRWCEHLPWDEAASARLEALAAGRSAGAPADGTPGRMGLLSPALVGRAGALTVLHDAWRSAADGGASVVVVEAEDGFGKSRLGQEFAGRVRRAGAPALVLRTRAYASEQARDGSTLARLVHQLAGARGLAAGRPAALAALASLVPELRERLPGLPPADAASDLLEAFTEVVCSLTAEQPVLLVLDDAPLADAVTLRAVARLIHRPPARTLVVLTGRPWALRESALAADLRQAATDVITLPLEPLDATAMGQLLESMAPVAAATRDELARMLHEATGGVPGHAAELVTRLAEAGVLAPDASGHWRMVAAPEASLLGPPRSAREAATERLLRLPPAARTVLEAATVAGPGAGAERLEVVSGLAPEAFQEALTELLLRRLLRPASTSGEFEFTSEALRRTTGELIPPSRRRALLRRMSGRHRAAPAGLAVAAALLLVATGGLFLRGRAERPVERERRLVVAAFENETGDSTLAWLGRAAADWLSQGVARTALVRVAPPAFDGIAPADVDLAVSGSFHRSGDSVHFRATLTDVDQAKILHVVGPVGAPVGEAMTAIDALRQRTLAVLAPWVDARMVAAAAVQASPPSYESYRAFAEGLDYYYRRNGAALGRFLHAYALDSTWATPLLYAVAQYDGLGKTAEMDSLLRVLEPRRGELAPYDRLTLDLHLARVRGDWAAQYTASLAAAELAPQSPIAAYWLPRAAIALNRPAEAMEFLDRIEAGRGEPSRMAGYWVMRASALHLLERYGEELAAAEELRRRFPADTRSHLFRARALGALGRLEEMDGVLEESLLLPVEPTWGAVGVAIHHAVADELGAHGYPAHARRVLERARDFCRSASPPVRQLPQQRFEEAQVLHRLGELDEARRIFEDLLAAGGTIGATPEELEGRIGMVAAAQGDTATAGRMDALLASAGIGNGYRAGQASEFRAGIRAALGEWEEAVRLLRQSTAEGRGFDSGKHAYPQFAGLRGHPPFREWLRPK